MSSQSSQSLAQSASSVPAPPPPPDEPAYEEGAVPPAPDPSVETEVPTAPPVSDEPARKGSLLDELKHKGLRKAPEAKPKPAPQQQPTLNLAEQAQLMAKKRLERQVRSILSSSVVTKLRSNVSSAATTRCWYCQSRRYFFVNL